eukprot:COSAG02_NODE_5118_length_4612_cov_48.722136_2_plen_188_part_00
MDTTDNTNTLAHAIAGYMTAEGQPLTPGQLRTLRAYFARAGADDEGMSMCSAIISRVYADADERIAASLRSVAPWSVPERPGRYTYMVTVPARVRVTTDVDLRTVPFFSLHRYYGLGYHNSRHGEVNPLPNTLEMVEPGPDVGVPASFAMHDNVSGDCLIDSCEGYLPGFDYGDVMSGALLREFIED